MSDPLTSPNLYELHGQHLRVTYSTTSFDGTARLDYKDAHQSLHFMGDQIRQLDTEIGTLVTVTTFKTIDTGSKSFSLLLPHVNLGSSHQEHSSRRNFNQSVLLTHSRSQQRRKGSVFSDAPQRRC